MSKHRKEDGHTPVAALRDSLLNTFKARPGKSGVPTRNKVAAAVVAAGAFAAVGQPLAASADADHSVRPVAQRTDLGAAVNGTAQSPAAVELLAAETRSGSKAEADKLGKSVAMEQARVAKETAERQAREAAAAAEQARIAAEQEAARAKAAFVKPAEGTFTSGFGARWGTTHKGVDIANSIGTPIKSVAAGKVVSAGPASGFGQWVRVQHDDGTVTVYGHINTIDVSVGQRVGAGEKIATMGNKGQSTGPHLHFEVLQGGSTKINPLPWLQERGITL
ncbi:M23 family metallopeptidase [Saccharopolyspora taberi]|uniref:M23 family metallopeptidase n=1 Tax=Saccharopolyspora taberi TaxID=60895 RepID=A0ABN3VKB5_9PSEU